jgi:hypothetical protein
VNTCKKGEEGEEEDREGGENACKIVSQIQYSKNNKILNSMREIERIRVIGFPLCIIQACDWQLTKTMKFQSMLH